ncbi:MAG: SRPBCC family protein [Pseudomonadota bacterium]
MVTFLRIVVALLLLIGLLVGGAFLLPRHVIVVRDIEIDAPPEAIFPEVNSLQAFSEWSPWAEMDPDMEQTFSGPEEGVGNAMTWSSDDPDLGSGSQVIVESVANERVATDLDFGDMGTAAAWFDLEPNDQGTLVVWGVDLDMGNSPPGRYMGLLMDSIVGADYQIGLQKLKTRVEAQVAQNAADGESADTSETVPDAADDAPETAEDPADPASDAAPGEPAETSEPAPDAAEADDDAGQDSESESATGN